MSAESTETPLAAPVHWGRRLYFSMLGIIALLALYPAYFHFRITKIENVRREVIQLGGRAPRTGGSSRPIEDIYWEALGGQLDQVLVSQVFFAPGARAETGTLARLRRLPDLVFLCLDGQSLDSAAWREVFAMQQLYELQVSYCELSDRDLAGIERLTELGSLDLSGTEIGDGAIERLSRLAALTDLNLENTNVTEAGLARLKRALPQATIKHRRWPTAAHAHAVRSLFRLGAEFELLEEPRGVGVRLIRSKWRGTPQDLSDLAQLADLRLLELVNLDLSPEMLAAVADSPRVTTLHLARARLRSVDLSPLFGSSVEHLILSDMFAEPVSLGKLRALVNLRTISFVNCRMIQGSLSSLSQLEGLSDLSVVGTRIRGTQLAELAALADLKRLSLVRTPLLVDSQVAELAALTSLESLTLFGTDASDGSILSLAQLRGLRELDVSKSQLSPAGLQRLQAALPDCRIQSQLAEPQLGLAGMIESRAPR